METVQRKEDGVTVSISHGVAVVFTLNLLSAGGPSIDAVVGTAILEEVEVAIQAIRDGFLHLRDGGKSPIRVSTAVDGDLIHMSVAIVRVSR
jgi:hypothetical protein